MVRLRLDECCTLEKGNTPIQKAVPGPYPMVVTAATRRTCDSYQFDAPSVCIPLVSSRGHGVASLNQVYYQEGKFALGNILCGVTPKDSKILNAKFLSYYLNFAKDWLIVPLMTGGANVSLTVKTLGKVKVFIPEIEEQQRIVEILDKFTSLVSSLDSEIALRQKQYEYYRNKLLSFEEGEEGVEWKTLNDCSINVCSGGTPSRSKSDYFEGNIPWLRTQEVDWNDVYDTEIKITEEAVKNSSAKLIPKNCVIIAMYGATAGKSCINKIPLTTNQACCNLQINDEIALYKYVFYYVCREYKNIKDMGEGSQNNINGQKVKNYPIPIPPLPKQLSIVRTLDTFESLLTNLKKERELRQKQYEYYREKLLTFA